MHLYEYMYIPLIHRSASSHVPGSTLEDLHVRLTPPRADNEPPAP